MIIKSILRGSIGTIVSLYYLWQEATKVVDEYTEAVIANHTGHRNLSTRSIQSNPQVNDFNHQLSSPNDRVKFGQKITIELNNKETNLPIAQLAENSPRDRAKITATIA